METEAQRVLREAMGKRRHKYGAKATTYNRVRYASKAEAEYAARLDMEVKAGTVRFWLRQVAIMLGDQRYIADFMRVDESAVVDGDMRPIGTDTRIRFIDVKGFETDQFLKVKTLWRKYGPCELHVVKGGATVEVVEPEGKR